MKQPQDYVHGHGVELEPPRNSGWSTLPVLHFLWGQPWDQLALNFAHSLAVGYRYPMLRVILSGHGEKTDAWLGRVTVYLNRDGTIKDIHQEVSVGLDGGYQHGHDLWVKAKQRGINL